MAVSLDERRARAVMILYREELWSTAELATLFGVSVEAISKIVTGRTWKEATGGVNISRHRRQTGYRLAHIQARLDQGCTSNSIIAKELGISRQAVAQLIKKHDLAGGPNCSVE